MAEHIPEALVEAMTRKGWRLDYDENAFLRKHSKISLEIAQQKFDAGIISEFLEYVDAKEHWEFKP